MNHVKYSYKINQPTTIQINILLYLYTGRKYKRIINRNQQDGI